MSKRYDIVVIGGGTAGLSAAQFAAHDARSVLLIESTALGGQNMQVAELENFPGLGPITGVELTERMEAQARALGVEIELSTVGGIREADGGWIVALTEREVPARAVIIASGSRPRKLGLEGEEELVGRGISFCAACDGPFFRDQAVGVVGGGDSACDEALVLSAFASRVYLFHRGKQLEAQGRLARAVSEAKNIETLPDCDIVGLRSGMGRLGIEKLVGVEVRDRRNQAVQSFELEALFECIGSEPVADFADGLKLSERGYILTDENLQTSLSGVFAAGEVRDGHFRQLVVVAAEGALSAHAACAFLDEA